MNKGGNRSLRHARPRRIMLSAIMTGLLATSCDDRPKDVLSDKEMTDLLVDMQLAEAYADVAGGGGGYSAERTRLADGVLAAHGVSRAQLDSTMIWYGKNIDVYNSLFVKVDKELDKRRKNLLADSGLPAEEQGVGIWPYSAHLFLSPLGDTDNVTFSIPAGEDVTKGDVITWKMRFNSMSDVMGTIGVDYTDGTTSIVSRNLSGNQRAELKIQTDSSRNPSRIFGVMRVRHTTSLPLFADSISVTATPMDSSRYYTFHSQTFLRKPSPKMEAPKENKDTVKAAGSDSTMRTITKRGNNPLKMESQKNGPTKLSGTQNRNNPSRR